MPKATAPRFYSTGRPKVCVPAGDNHTLMAPAAFRLLSFCSLKIEYRLELPSMLALIDTEIKNRGKRGCRKDYLMIRNPRRGRHCDLWKEKEPHPPPKPQPNQLIPPALVERSILDFDFFERNCA
jgi:hypothetical protein